MLWWVDSDFKAAIICKYIKKNMDIINEQMEYLSSEAETIKKILVMKSTKKFH